MDSIWVCVWMDLCLEAAVSMMPGILTIIITIHGSGARPGLMLNLQSRNIENKFLGCFFLFLAPDRGTIVILSLSCRAKLTFN